MNKIEIEKTIDTGFSKYFNNISKIIANNIGKKCKITISEKIDENNGLMLQDIEFSENFDELKTYYYNLDYYNLDVEFYKNCEFQSGCSFVKTT
jgi:hypothetical protein